MVPSRLLRIPSAMDSDDDRQISESLTARYSAWIHDALDTLRDNFLLTNSAIPGYPIVFASRGVLSMSGYARTEVLGRKSRMFQGPATCRRSVMDIREAIREERELQISLLNYCRDGSPHWILFHLCPVFAPGDGDVQREVAHFVSVQVPIPKRGARRAVFSSRCRDSMRLEADFECSLTLDESEMEMEERAAPSKREREKAESAADEVISALTRYGRLSRGKRMGVQLLPPLSAAVNISLGRIKQSFVLANPHVPDMPIVYVSDEFLRLTGYYRQDVLGRNCRFLNGPGTDVKALKESTESDSHSDIKMKIKRKLMYSLSHVVHINDSIQAQRACSVHLLNYRKDGSPFWNLLYISPVRNAAGKIAFIVGVQVEEGSKNDVHGLSPEMRQLGAVGAVKVAVRSLSAGVDPSRSS